MKRSNSFDSINKKVHNPVLRTYLDRRNLKVRGSDTEEEILSMYNRVGNYKNVFKESNSEFITALFAEGLLSVEDVTRVKEVFKQDKYNSESGCLLLNAPLQYIRISGRNNLVRLEKRPGYSASTKVMEIINIDGKGDNIANKLESCKRCFLICLYVEKFELGNKYVGYISFVKYDETENFDSFRSGIKNYDVTEYGSVIKPKEEDNLENIYNLGLKDKNFLHYDDRMSNRIRNMLDELEDADESFHYDIDDYIEYENFHQCQRIVFNICNLVKPRYDNDISNYGNVNFTYNNIFLKYLLDNNIIDNKIFYNLSNSKFENMDKNLSVSEAPLLNRSIVDFYEFRNRESLIEYYTHLPQHDSIMLRDDGDMCMLISKVINTIDDENAYTTELLYYKGKDK